MVNGNRMSAKGWERVGLIVGGPIAQNKVGSMNYYINQG